MADTLTGRGIAITRPGEQARVLATLVAEQGGQAILFPLLAIEPLDDITALETTLRAADPGDWAIFISTNAVQQGMPHLLRHHPRLPEKLRFAAIGPGTVAALKSFGVHEVLAPATRFDSEHLLDLPPLRAVRGQRVMVFRGTGGRELLAEQLHARGATVLLAECYRRVCPQTDVKELARLWAAGRLHAIVVTSSESLRHLLRLAGDADWLRQCPLCVNHARIAEEARAQGLQAAVAATPDDASMLHCLMHQCGNA